MLILLDDDSPSDSSQTGKKRESQSPLRCAALKADEENVNKKYFPDILADLSDNDDTSTTFRNNFL